MYSVCPQVHWIILLLKVKGKNKNSWFILLFEYIIFILLVYLASFQD